MTGTTMTMLRGYIARHRTVGLIAGMVMWNLAQTIAVYVPVSIHVWGVPLFALVLLPAGIMLNTVCRYAEGSHEWANRCVDMMMRHRVVFVAADVALTMLSLTVFWKVGLPQRHGFGAMFVAEIPATIEAVAFLMLVLNWKEAKRRYAV